MLLYLPGQLSATRILCHLYKYDCPDQTRCIIYNEYQIHLLRHLKDQIQESEVLEILSEIYLNLGTERWVFVLRAYHMVRHVACNLQRFVILQVQPTQEHRQQRDFLSTLKHSKIRIIKTNTDAESLFIYLHSKTINGFSRCPHGRFKILLWVYVHILASLEKY